MSFLGPTRHKRLNEALAFVYLAIGLFLFLGLISYNPYDPSWNTVTSARATNLTGRVGAFFADLLLQGFGMAAYSVPMLVLALGWKWIRNAPINAPWLRIFGGTLLVTASATAFGLLPDWRVIGGAIALGGLVGAFLAQFLLEAMNLTGAILITIACWIVALYIVSRFEVAHLMAWMERPVNWLVQVGAIYQSWRARIAASANERAAARAKARAEARAADRAEQRSPSGVVPPPLAAAAAAAAKSSAVVTPSIADPNWPPPPLRSKARAKTDEAKPVVDELLPIPIKTLELPPSVQDTSPPWEDAHDTPKRKQDEKKPRTHFRLPSTTLLREPQERTAFDAQELQDTAVRIKSKFEEFNVFGKVEQINPGPVVTTFEFKPEAGVKYSRITTLTEDLCLGLQAESILIERIPGKSTVGIEVPNSKREVIALRQILESEEFLNSASSLTVALGKDINGRIKVASLETMPHLLIAGSTGSGKSVMLNSLIMSILYKSTPDQVRMIMVDPKRLEFGPYEGIPHLLTPVITDAKKATNALRNAVLEMERRLKLLAAQGVRNIEQYNKKIRQMGAQPRSLFEEESAEDPLEPLPYILIIIDELADLMMLERANVEESVTRLAQMARAVGMHLVLATQRPSVDVITGLIKANFPSRISFRVATRVDSRTVLDEMGAEHLLGKGDMLYLPPGTSRKTRVHGAYVSEGETGDVVDFWKKQAAPEYDQTFLLAPPSDDEEGDAEDLGPEDPMYQEAVRTVCEIGKASTSTLQRRLRLGYGRAARILDMMQRDGIIGPPDGSRPRDVLKRPDWLTEVEEQLR